MASIGKYVVRGLLGRGGMGKVLKVEVPVIGRMAALKLLEPHPSLVALIGKDAIRERFTAEAVTMAGIRHPNICAVHDFGEDEGRLFFLMDYFCNNVGLMIGETHDPDAPSRPLTVEKAVRYASQVLKGLDRLHFAGIVHRDIKPFNLLLTEEGQVKICDFGLSRVRGERWDTPGTLKVGSPGYAAPEQAEDPNRAEAPADLYAAGVVLYRLLTGRLPAGDPAPISVLHPDLGPGWDGFMDRMLAREPSQRFRSAGEALSELDALVVEWRSEMGDVCRLFEEKPPLRAPGDGSFRRRTPVKTGYRNNRERLGLDALWRPRAYTENRFTGDSGDTLTDRATGLVWQRSGSPYPVDWEEAMAYVAGLNARDFAGRSDWRLPTVDELLTLLTPEPHGTDYCLEPVFPAFQRSLWSSDRRAWTTAWYVSLEVGFAAWQDMTCYHHVKAVRSL
ncbi:MAG: protein kinase domain-containing protein [Desulfobacterales bacterium]